MEYTFDDIVTAKDILTGKVKEEDIIGKKGWFLDCIPQDMSLNVIARIGTFSELERIDLGSLYLFRIKNNFYTCFLPEKEESAPEESYEKRQAKWVEANDIKVGDKVRIADRWNDDALRVRVPDMEPLLGKVLEVRSVLDDSICLWTPDRDDFWYWPYTMLEKVEDNALKQVENIPEWQLRGYCNSRKPEYVPFDLSREEDRQLLRDVWIKSNYNGNEARISAFKHDETRGWLAHIPQTGMRDGEQLFNNYTFIDGTPVGKLKDMPF